MDYYGPTDHHPDRDRRNIAGTHRLVCRSGAHDPIDSDTNDVDSDTSDVANDLDSGANDIDTDANDFAIDVDSDIANDADTLTFCRSQLMMVTISSDDKRRKSAVQLGNDQ